MSELMLRNLDEALFHDLQRQAAEQGVSAEDEAKRILHQVLQRKRRLDEFVREADVFARRVGPQTIDSTDLIREERVRL